MDILVCPECLSRLKLEADDVKKSGESSLAVSGARCKEICAYSEFFKKGKPFESCGECLLHTIKKGRLKCGNCSAVYPIDDFIPVMLQKKLADKTQATRRSFGYIWGHSSGKNKDLNASSLHEPHFHKIATALSELPGKGLWLEAGCGNGADINEMLQAVRGLEIVGMDISDGGVRESYKKHGNNISVHIVQGDIAKLPFKNDIFDFAYSYGVLHHLEKPGAGIKRINEVLKKGAKACIYLYEDFSDRTFFERFSLSSVNVLRNITTRIHPKIMHALCYMAAPFVYLFLALPARALAVFDKTRPLAMRIPYHHVKGFFDGTADLYDRFSPPFEFRFSRDSSIRFLSEHGFRDVGIANRRGWIVWGTKG